ncbi:MAG: GerMN domain-containing protein [Lachnospiraceae bacterium]|nr:GerMN domain-containing protein [Lachnospiraceae bacterium]
MMQDKRHKKKHIILLFVLVLGLLLPAGCGSQEPEQTGNVYHIYMVNKEETRIDYTDVSTDIDNQGQLVTFLLMQLTNTPVNTTYRAAIQEGVSMPSVTIRESTVTLDFESDYYNYSTGGEILSRAAIVRTLTQVPGLSYCSFLVGGNALLSATGLPVGIMRADQFIDNNGNEINTEEKVTLALYFADEDGEGLIKVNREVVYSSNIPVEKLVLEQLISGVTEDEAAMGANPVINGDTKVLSVIEKDGICYVNLDTGFLAVTQTVSPEVALYSIVNSLVELGNVNKVQFSVNGETEILFREKYSLDSPYDRNLEIIKPESVVPAAETDD